VTDGAGNVVADLGSSRLPRWSPLGYVLLYAVDNQVWVWDAEEYSASPASSPGEDADVPVGWQERQLYYLRITAGGLELWGADWKGANPFLVWTGEGLSLASQSAAVVPNGFLVPTSGGWLRIDLDGTVTELGGGVVPESAVVTSPGGTLISFVANSQLIVSEVTNPGAPLMTLDLATGSSAGWAFAPSGEELAVTDGQRVVIVAIDGTIRAESQVPEGWNVAGPLWTPDGLYLAVDSDTQPAILLLDPNRLAA
jgi:hypothetical protein